MLIKLVIKLVIEYYVSVWHSGYILFNAYALQS